MFSSLPNAKYFSFLNEDFFTWEPAEKFDLIVDYTYVYNLDLCFLFIQYDFTLYICISRSFFCAFEPAVRPLWAQRMEKLLKPGGELITLMFPVRIITSIFSVPCPHISVVAAN